MMASQQKHQNQQGTYTAETMTTAAVSSSTGGGDCPRCLELENPIQELQRQLTTERKYSHEQQTAHVALIQQMQTEQRQNEEKERRLIEWESQLLMQQLEQQKQQVEQQTQLANNAIKSVENSQVYLVGAFEKIVDKIDARHHATVLELDARHHATVLELDARHHATVLELDARHQATVKELATQNQSTVMELVGAFTEALREARSAPVVPPQVLAVAPQDPLVQM